MEQSDTGEAASMEIALLLGLTGTYAPESLRSRLPALDRDTIVMLGQRDHLYRRQIGVPTIAGQVPLHPLEELRGDPAGIATDAAEHLVRHAHGWWLHIDLDVLAGSEFPACDAATDPATPGGLTWTELVTVTTAALRTAGRRRRPRPGHPRADGCWPAVPTGRRTGEPRAVSVAGTSWARSRNMPPASTAPSWATSPVAMIRAPACRAASPIMARSAVDSWLASSQDEHVVPMQWDGPAQLAGAFHLAEGGGDVVALGQALVHQDPGRVG